MMVSSKNEDDNLNECIEETNEERKWNVIYI